MPETLGSAFDDRRFAVIDIETTGLDRSKDCILQVAVVETDAAGTVIETWSSYCRPRRWPLVRVGSRPIHGITRATIRRAPPVAEVMGELTTRVAGKVVTAHNINFDLSFIELEARRAGLVLQPHAELCTLALSRSLDPERSRSHRLGDLCERYGVELTRAHDALADALATAAVLSHLITESRLTDWDRLISAGTPRRRRDQLAAEPPAR
jgi:DNA polymerase-3 subunit epsilon